MEGVCGNEEDSSVLKDLGQAAWGCKFFPVIYLVSPL